MSSKVFVIIPTYNEKENLPLICKALFDLNIDDLNILVVDDASPDGTGEVADRLSAENSHIHVMHRKGKLGLGTAYVQGFDWALGRDAQFVIQMDADFSHSPSYVPQLLEAIKDFDVVVGSRYIKGGSVDKTWSSGRRLLSWWANSVWVRLILGLKTKDATAGFRCWRAEALRQIGLENARSNGYIFQVETCFMAERKGLRIKEIPIYFEDRRGGSSKMSFKIKVEAALRVIDIRRRYKEYSRL